jgi:hypothetical protein
MGIGTEADMRVELQTWAGAGKAMQRPHFRGVVARRTTRIVGADLSDRTENGLTGRNSEQNGGTPHVRTFTLGVVFAHPLS